MYLQIFEFWKKLRSSSSSAEEIVLAMVPNDPNDKIIRTIAPRRMDRRKTDPRQMGVIGSKQMGPGEIGASDTINDIAALAALSDLDQEERIEKVREHILIKECFLSGIAQITTRFKTKKSNFF